MRGLIRVGISANTERVPSVLSCVGNAKVHI